MASIHKITIEGIGGGAINFADFEGKKIMVVNVASECGFTTQYQQLQELYTSFEDKLVIVGIPANDFGNQEPGENHEIQAFCQKNYGVTFPISSKVSVVKPDKHPLYRWLTEKALNGVMDSEVEWNFQKYILDENGQLIKSYPSSVSPISEEILDWVNN